MFVSNQQYLKIDMMFNRVPLQCWFWEELELLRYGPAVVCLLCVQGNHPVEHYNNLP